MMLFIASALLSNATSCETRTEGGRNWQLGDQNLLRLVFPGVAFAYELHSSLSLSRHQTKADKLYMFLPE